MIDFLYKKKLKARYKSIKDLPIAVFQEILETGNLSLLGHGTAKELEAAWATIFDEFIQHFGLSDGYKSYMRHQQKAVELYAKAYTKNQLWLLAVAKVEEAKAKDALSGGEGGGFALAVAQVSKAMGFRVDPKNTTTFEFYSYIKLIEENGKRESKRQ